MDYREKELLEQYVKAKRERDKVREIEKELTSECEEAAVELCEFLEARGADRTARYADLGYATLLSPDLYASCPKENEEELFQMLKEHRRDDLIKPTVHPRALSGFIKELMKDGTTVPEIINYYLKPRIRLNPPKVKEK